MKNKQEELTTLGNLLLEIGALLMSSGASTGRIRVTINRIAEAKGYQCDLLITHRALMLTLGDTDHPSFFSSLKRTSPHGRITSYNVCYTKLLRVKNGEVLLVVPNLRIFFQHSIFPEPRASSCG